MKTSLLPLLCLLIGGAAGYGLRVISSGQGVEVVQSALDKNLINKVAEASRKSGAPVDESSSNSDLSLGDLMKDLLVDFDPKSALKAVKELSASEIQSALALVAAMPKSQDRDSLLKELYAAWAYIDPYSAWKAARADPLDQKDGRLLRVVAGVLTKTNPLAAIDLAMSLGEGRRRTVAMASIFEEWSRMDVSAAIAYTNEHPEKPIELLSFYEGLSNLAEKDPLKAANLALTIKGLESRSFVLSGLLEVWVERDLAAALKWSQALTNTELREDATSKAVEAWAKSDPAEALNYVQRITDNDTRIKSFLGAWNGWFHHSPEAALSYLRSTHDEKLLESASYYILSYLRRTGSKERLELLTKVPEGPTKQRIYQSLAGEQVRAGQYNDALVLLNAMPDSSERDRQVLQLGQAWAKADFPAATKWLKIQPASSDRDLALTGYALALAGTNPTAAIREVNTIPDAALRRDALKVVAFRWYQADAAQAEAWMTGSSGFSEKDIEFVRFKAKVTGDYLPLTPTVGQRQ
jgi:hypothetical protein